jgi:uncharacterized protein with ParB-like and HNH nuclease domain
MIDAEFTYDDEKEILDENIPYLTYDLVTYPSDLTCQALAEMFKSGDIIIPEYQRNYVWTQKQASLLIAHF